MRDRHVGRFTGIFLALLGSHVAALSPLGLPRHLQRVRVGQPEPPSLAQLRRTPLLLSSLEDDAEVQRLKAAAEKLRGEVAALEAEREAQLEAARASAFAAFDTNKDGVVSTEELRTGLQDRYGLTATDGQLDELFKEFDQNSDGVLQLKEFQVLMPRAPEVGVRPTRPRTHSLC